MDKVLPILEKYVEWIAIAIGGLIFMFAVWIYWISPDVNAEVLGRSLRPGAVDEAVLEGPGESLRLQIENTRDPPVPPPPDLRRDFTTALTMESYTPQRLLAMSTGSSTLGIAASDSAGVISRPDQAPVPPPAEIVRLASGRSYADVPGARQAGNTVDLAEVRVDFTVSGSEIADAFRRVRIPANQQNTSILRVELERERMLPDGSWGERMTQVPLLNNNPLASQQVPAESVSAQDKQAYAQFAAQNPEWVLRPPFYEVRAGDNPMDLKVVVDVPRVGDQATPAADEAGEGDEQGGDEQTNYNFQDPPERDEGRGGAGAAGQTAPPPGQNTQPGQPQATAGQDGQEDQGLAPLAPGEFNAAQHGTPITGWAWDTSAEPGESYRYRVTYVLKNPLFGTRGAAGRPELENTLALRSEPSEWSPPITVEPLLYFYMTEGGGAHAVFTVFKWQNGAWQSERFRVTAGDAIGTTTANGIDYRTGRTLVDIRDDSATRESFTLLVDSQGRFTRRTIRDGNDPKLKELQEEINAPRDGGVAQGE